MLEYGPVFNFDVLKVPLKFRLKSFGISVFLQPNGPVTDIEAPCNSVFVIGLLCITALTFIVGPVNPRLVGYGEKDIFSDDVCFSKLLVICLSHILIQKN